MDGASTDDSDEARAAARAKTKAGKRGYVYLHSAIDGYTRMAYAEPLPDEKAATAVAFVHRARAWFAAHGITHIERIVTDNGACYRADLHPSAARGKAQTDQALHPRSTMARSSGTTGSWPKSFSTHAPGPAKPNDQQQLPCGTFTTTTTGPIAQPVANRPLRSPPDQRPANAAPRARWFTAGLVPHVSARARTTRPGGSPNSRRSSRPLRDGLFT